MGRRIETDWAPTEIGEQLAGTLTDGMVVTDTRWGDVAVAVITEEHTGTKVGVWLSRKVLRRLFEEQRPSPGSLIVIQYNGERTSSAGHQYHLYVLITDTTLSNDSGTWIEAFQAECRKQRQANEAESAPFTELSQ